MKAYLVLYRISAALTQRDCAARVLRIPCTTLTYIIECTEPLPVVQVSRSMLGDALSLACCEKLSVPGKACCTHRVANMHLSRLKQETMSLTFHKGTCNEDVLDCVFSPYTYITYDILCNGSCSYWESSVLLCSCSAGCATHAGSTR